MIKAWAFEEDLRSAIIPDNEIGEHLLMPEQWVILAADEYAE